MKLGISVNESKMDLLKTQDIQASGILTSWNIIYILFYTGVASSVYYLWPALYCNIYPLVCYKLVLHTQYLSGHHSFHFQGLLVPQ